MAAGVSIACPFYRHPPAARGKRASNARPYTPSSSEIHSTRLTTKKARSAAVMGKLFGTDGIRGIVGENLTAELAYRVGQAVTLVLTEEKGAPPLITIRPYTPSSSEIHSTRSPGWQWRMPHTTPKLSKLIDVLPERSRCKVLSASIFSCRIRVVLYPAFFISNRILILYLSI